MGRESCGLLGTSYSTYKRTFHVTIFLAYLPDQLTFFFPTRIELLVAQYKAEMFLFDMMLFFPRVRGEYSRVKWGNVKFTFCKNTQGNSMEDVLEWTENGARCPR